MCICKICKSVQHSNDFCLDCGGLWEDFTECCNGELKLINDFEYFCNFCIQWNTTTKIKHVETLEYMKKAFEYFSN